MPLQAGIVGLPNVGKSTLFNAITKAGAETANYPFCTIDPNVGVVEVPDERLAALDSVVHSRRIVPTAFEFVDIAGLVRGASKGEGLGNQFLSHIREVDAVCHVVRCFEDHEISHVHGEVRPVDDVDIIETELLLADLDTVERRLEKTRRASKAGEEKIKKEAAALDVLATSLQEGRPARSLVLDETGQALLRELHLLTAKPVLFVANVSEDDFPAAVADPEAVPLVAELNTRATREGAPLVVVSAKIETEIAELDPDERQAFIESLGAPASGLDRLIHAAYRRLGLCTFFTAGEKEVRAWTVRQGATAPQAAGVIHTDFETGFIRAETIAWHDLVEAGSYAAARERGLLRLEGKGYVVQDGDVMHFRFNV